MIATRVEHPTYGPGQIVALFRNGEEWMVRFDSGLRFRRPRQEFNGQMPNTPTPAAVFAPTPMTPSQLDARSLIEALRVGVAPAHHAQELTIGLESERASLGSALVQAHQRGGDVRAIIGEYGYGKSHIVELTAQEALQRKFLVASVSLDLQELPPHRAFDIYGALMRSLRYPESDERGLGPLLQAVAGVPRLRDELRELAPTENDPLVVGLDALSSITSTRQQTAWQNWLMGGPRAKSMNKATPRGVKFPSIYRQGNNARQMSYLLSGVSVLARLAGYSGLCVLIDEAESYSLLLPYQQPKAALFFSAVIHAALGDERSHLSAADLPQHHRRDYPPAYGDRQSLFFLFTITRSDNRLPLEDWLDDEKVLALDPHHTPQEIGQFLEQVMGYHALAYGYEVGERQRQVRRGAAEHLAQGMRNDRLNIRGVVRLAVELYDLLYLHPEYEVAALLDELRGQMR